MEFNWDQNVPILFNLLASTIALLLFLALSVPLNVRLEKQGSPKPYGPASIKWCYNWFAIGIIAWVLLYTLILFKSTIPLSSTTILGAQHFLSNLNSFAFIVVYFGMTRCNSLKYSQIKNTAGLIFFLIIISEFLYWLVGHALTNGKNSIVFMQPWASTLSIIAPFAVGRAFRMRYGSNTVLVVATFYAALQPFAFGIANNPGHDANIEIPTYLQIDESKIELLHTISKLGQAADAAPPPYYPNDTSPTGGDTKTGAAPGNSQHDSRGAYTPAKKDRYVINLKSDTGIVYTNTQAMNELSIAAPNAGAFTKLYMYFIINFQLILFMSLAFGKLALSITVLLKFIQIPRSYKRAVLVFSPAGSDDNFKTIELLLVSSLVFSFLAAILITLLVYKLPLAIFAATISAAFTLPALSARIKNLLAYVAKTYL